jgi:hypothetical protein
MCVYVCMYVCIYIHIYIYIYIITYTHPYTRNKDIFLQTHQKASWQQFTCIFEHIRIVCINVHTYFSNTQKTEYFLTITPESALTTVDFPWATWPMVPILMVAWRLYVYVFVCLCMDSCMCICVYRSYVTAQNTSLRSFVCTYIFNTRNSRADTHGKTPRTCINATYLITSGVRGVSSPWLSLLRSCKEKEFV